MLGHGRKLVVERRLGWLAGRWLRRFIRRRRRRSGAVALAKHDLDLIEGLIDRTVTLSGGHLVDLADSGDSLRVRYREAIRRSQ